MRLNLNNKKGKKKKKMQKSSSIMDLVVVKFGGSYLTDKRQFETARDDALQRAAEWVAQQIRNGSRVVVVHGAGSFGHQIAHKYHIATHGLRGPPEAALGAALCRQSVLALNRLLVEALLAHSIPAVTVSPFPAIGGPAAQGVAAPPFAPP